jgi:hypothetical protein
MSEQKTIELYEGKILVEFSAGSHRYKINGKTGTPSVTAITGILNKPALVYWSANLARDFLLAKMARGEAITDNDIIEASRQHTIKKTAEATSGSLVHDWIERYIKGQKPEIPDDERVVNGVNAFMEWVEQNKIKFVDSEKIVYSKKHGYVGIMDFTCTMGAEKHKILHAGDIKTSSGIYPEMAMQVSAYQMADEEESGRVYGDKVIVRCDKDGAGFEAKWFPAEQHKDDCNGFLGLLQAKKWLNNNK